MKSNWNSFFRLGLNLIRGLESLKKQFIIGLFINLLFVSVLLSFSESSYNLWSPEGPSTRNIWEKSDVPTYIAPAKAFLKTGQFNSGLSPDYHRTIGYPLFLSLFMKMAGNYWNIAVIFFQAFLFALVYPLISMLLRFFFPDHKFLSSYTFTFLLFTGSYFFYTADLYTDTLFTLLLLAGIFFGLKGTQKGRFGYVILEMLLIGFAAQVRPTLALFPLLNILLVLFSRRFQGAIKVCSKKTLVASTGILLLLCNGPAIRNYYNYGCFIPSDVMHDNLVCYLTKRVMNDLGKNEAYKSRLEKIIELENRIENTPLHDASARFLFRKSLETKKDFALPLLLGHPVLTMKWIIGYGLYNTFDYHWGHIFNFWGLHWHKDHKFKTISRLSLFLFVLWFFIYLTIYFLFGIFIVVKILSKEYLFIGIFILMMLPFLASFSGGGGARMRLPVEWFFIAGAISTVIDFKRYFFQNNSQDAKGGSIKKSDQTA